MNIYEGRTLLSKTVDIKVLPVELMYYEMTSSPSNPNNGTLITVSAFGHGGYGTLMYNWTLTRASGEVQHFHGMSFEFTSHTAYGLYNVEVTITDFYGQEEIGMMPIGVGS